MYSINEANGRIEINRQIKMAWYRGNQLGFVSGVVATLVVALIVKIFF